MGLASYNGQAIIYDNVGNPTTYLGKSLSWSHNRQLDRYDNTTFAYNAEGIRISKTNNNITTNYYLEGTKILAQSNGNTLIFHYGMEGASEIIQIYIPYATRQLYIKEIEKLEYCFETEYKKMFEKCTRKIDLGIFLKDGSNPSSKLNELYSKAEINASRINELKKLISLS